MTLNFALKGKAVLKIGFLLKARLRKIFKVTIIKFQNFNIFSIKNYHSSLVQLNYQRKHNSEFDSYTLGTTV